VQDLGFALPVGARYALIGPNGAGKTTLVNLLTGNHSPSAGRIRLGGSDITFLSPHLRVRRGLVRTFQINQLFPALTPLEAVALALLERDGLAGDWRRPLGRCTATLDEAYGLLKSLGIESDGERPTRELPYGRQRLLEIALALAARPKVLLLDEPAAGVPRSASAAIFAALEALPPEIAVLFIEHDMELVFRFATRILVMVGGRLLVEGSPDAVAADERVRQVYLGRANGR
jgi:branched-chain amino acid transport system ATP-binding protein